MCLCDLKPKPDVHALIAMIKDKDPNLSAWVYSPKMKVYSTRNFSHTLHDYRLKASIFLPALFRYSKDMEYENVHEQIFAAFLPVYLDLCSEFNSVSLMLYLWLTLQIDPATKHEAGNFKWFLTSHYCNPAAIRMMRWLDASLKAIMLEELSMWHLHISVHGLPM